MAALNNDVSRHYYSPMPNLKLSRSTGRDNMDPTEDDVLASMRELDEDEGFLILSSADEEYVQASGPCLEYRDSTGHYRANRGNTDRETIRRVFIDYHRGRADWRRHVIHWENVTEELAADPRDYDASGFNTRMRLFALVIAILGLALLFWIVTS